LTPEYSGKSAYGIACVAIVFENTCPLLNEEVSVWPIPKTVKLIEAPVSAAAREHAKVAPVRCGVTIQAGEPTLVADQQRRDLRVG
jgi:hypothetical protein